MSYLRFFNPGFRKLLLNSSAYLPNPLKRSLHDDILSRLKTWNLSHININKLHSVSPYSQSKNYFSGTVNIFDNYFNQDISQYEIEKVIEIIKYSDCWKKHSGNAIEKHLIKISAYLTKLGYQSIKGEYIGILLKCLGNTAFSADVEM